VQAAHSCTLNLDAQVVHTMASTQNSLLEAIRSCLCRSSFEIVYFELFSSFLEIWDIVQAPPFIRYDIGPRNFLDRTHAVVHSAKALVPKS
jgi:hypothetical protein